MRFDNFPTLGHFSKQVVGKWLMLMLQKVALAHHQGHITTLTWHGTDQYQSSSFIWRQAFLAMSIFSN